MLNVWTVLWIGDGPWKYTSRPANMPPPDEPETRLFAPSDVIKFERMVRQHLPECNFRCLSNVPVPGIECLPLKTGMVGWWPKMELFRPGLPTGRNLYFDLDTILVRDIDELVSFPAPFAAIEPGREVGSDRRDPWLDQERRWRFPKYQTSVMTWETEYVARFWKKWSEVEVIYDESGFSSGAGVSRDWIGRLASDQDFLGEQFPNEARFPTEWFTRINRCVGRERAPRPPIKVVLTMRLHNDGAAKRYKWVAERWK